MNPAISYPQYRKYPNEKGYFKIISTNEWEEIQVLANTYSIHTFKATILPDRNYIYDLTFDYTAYWVVIEEEEYEKVKQKLKC